MIPPAPIALIVEDDDDIREVLETVAQRAGFETATARHGLEALRYLRQHDERPSVILLDLMMPIMDGNSFLERRDASMKEIPVVVLTAKTDPHVPEGVQVLRKPVSMELVLDALCRYVH